MATLSPAVREIFQGKNFAHIATLMPDGSPQVTPVWVDVDGDRILVNTAEGRTKTRNVRRDPRVAISVVDHENPYTSAFIRGRIVDITKDGAEEHIDKLAKKYMGVDIYPMHDPAHPRVIFVIEPEHVSGMSV